MKIKLATLIMSIMPSLTLASTIKPLIDDKVQIPFKSEAMRIIEDLNWHTISATKTHLVFLHSKNIMYYKGDPTVIAMFRHTLREDLENGEFSNYVDYLEKHDCLNKTVKLLAMHEYVDNKLIKSKTWDYPPEPILEVTSGQQKQSVVCQFL